MEQVLLDNGMIEEVSDEELKSVGAFYDRKIGTLNFPKINDIFVNSWGYDQTNIDFYKVIAITKKSVKVRQLKSIETETGFLSGVSIPSNEFKEDSRVLVKRVCWDSDNEVYINMEFGWCNLWNGKPESYSSYA